MTKQRTLSDAMLKASPKQLLFEHINDHIKPAREEYSRLIEDPAIVEQELLKGAVRAGEVSGPYLDEIRQAVGIRRLK